MSLTPVRTLCQGTEEDARLAPLESELQVCAYVRACVRMCVCLCVRFESVYVCARECVCVSDISARF